MIKNTKNKKRKIEVFLVFGILTILFCSLVSAIGFSYSYGKDNPLEVYPGETKIVKVSLQSAEAEEIKARAILLNDGGIASIDEDKEYTLSSGKSEIVDVKLEIPDDAVIGSKYTVELEFKEINPQGGGGMVGLTTSAALNIYAYVVEEPAEETPEGISTTWMILAIVLVVAIIAVIWFVAKSKKASAEPVK